jgi:hypothetical protein
LKAIITFSPVKTKTKFFVLNIKIKIVKTNAG